MHAFGLTLSHAIIGWVDPPTDCSMIKRRDDEVKIWNIPHGIWAGNPIPRASVSERAGARFPTAQLVSRGWGLLTVFISHPIPSSHVNNSIV